MLQIEEKITKLLCTNSYWHFKAKELFLDVLKMIEMMKNII